MTRYSSLILLASLSVAGVAQAEESDEPGLYSNYTETRPTARSQAQVADVEIPRYVSRYAPPALPAALPPPAMPAPMVLRAPVDRGPFWTLDAGVGYSGFVALFGPSVSGPMFNTSLALTFGGGRAKHGVRLGGYIGLMHGDDNYGYENESLEGTRLLGANLAYVVQVGGFWLSAGWGMLKIEATRQVVSYDDVNQTHETTDSATLPEGVLALGYDFRFSRHLGLRLSGELGTLLVTWRAQAAASLVVRF